VLNEYEAEKFLKKYVPVANSILIKNKANLEKVKSFPTVLKIISNNAIHKTEIQGVIITSTKNELENSYNELLQRAKKHKIKIEGILAQDYYEGIELLIGIKKDQVFNRVIVFGLGGIYTEILKEVVIRKCPISMEDAEEMIYELKYNDIFSSRGNKINKSKLAEILVKVSNLYKQPIQELDINPFIINNKEAYVVDARIVFE